MPLPNSLPWMESVDAKMIRAHEHIEMLDREITQYLSGVTVKIHLMTSPAQPLPWLVTYADDYVPPIRLSAIVGDCVHNMRSALDNLVCGLALTRDRFCKCDDLGFPYTEHEAGWNGSSPLKLAGVPKAAKKIIKKLQPWSDTVQPSPLVILNKLSNIDKHRQCNIAFACSTNTVFRVHCNDGQVVEIRARKPLYFGDVQDFTLLIDKSSVQPSARVEASGTFVLSFRESGPWSDLPVSRVLHQCCDHIEKNVIGALKRFVEPVPTI